MATITSKTSKSSPSAARNTKLLIFDFDGVLADSFDIFYQLNKAAFACLGLNLTTATYQGFFNGNIHARFRSFIKDDRQYSAFKKYRQRELAKSYTKVKLFSFVPSLIKKLGGRYQLAICSSTPRKLILELLKKHRLDKNFFFISGNQEHSKAEVLQTITQKASVTKKQIVMITDTVGDVLAAKKVGLKTMAVTWGFHSRSALLQAHPDKIVRDFVNLEKLLIST